MLRCLELKRKIYASLAIVIFLVALAFCLRILNIDKEFTGDEQTLVSISKLPLHGLLSELKQREVYPPLTYILFHYWLVLNQSAGWLRLYFILFGIGTCILIYMIAGEYLGDRCARIALALSAFSPLLIFISQVSRSYSDSAFWMLLSAFFMLKIVKGEDNIYSRTGYVAAAAISIYTFYFSALFICIQLIFFLIFQPKKWRYFGKTLLTAFAIAAIFLPWIPSALGQFRNTSSIVYDWSDKGFNLGPFRFGLYARNMISLIGLDPSFMIFQGGVTKHFSKFLLAGVVFSTFILGSAFLYHCYRYLKSAFPGPSEKPLIWFPFFLSLGPLIMSWLTAGTLNVLPNARYLVAPHALFLLLISVFVCSIWLKGRRYGMITLSLILLIFATRIPYAVSPEIDYRGSTRFLSEHLPGTACLICIGDCPALPGKSNLVVVEGKYVIMNERKSGYLPLPEEGLMSFKDKIRPFYSAWLYKVYGHYEVFGLYDQIDRLLKESGYKSIATVHFQNVDIVQYKKDGAL